MKFFYGENELEIRENLGKIREKFAPENVIFAEISDENFARIFAEIFQTDLFGSRKLFVVKNPFSRKDLAENLAANFQKIPEENEIILLEKNPDKRTKIFKDFAKIAETKEFANLKSWELEKWLSTEVKSRKIAMDSDARKELVSRKSGAENPQNAIARELEKFAILGEKISRKTVEKFVDEDPAANVFEILNLAISAKFADKKSAENSRNSDEKNADFASKKNEKSAEKIREKMFAELKILKKSGEDPNRFLGLIASQIFALNAVIFGIPDAAKNLKINPFQLQKARETAAKIPISERGKFAENLAENLAKTDAKMKLSDAENSWILVENLLGKL